ncbi:hypothetical protein ES703_49560 [subsurface metagenome]
MPEVTDLGYCPRCGIDLTEETIGFIKHVKFCRICRDWLNLNPDWIPGWISIADYLKGVIK